MPLNLTGCGVVSACSIDFSGAATSPSTAGIGYGVFGYSGVGLGFGSAASGPNQGIAFFTCGDFERMRIVSSGKVGLGTSSPSHPLHIYDGGNSVYARWQRSSGDMYVGSDSIGGAIGTTGNIPLYFYTVDGTERMRLTQCGTLMVGASTNNTSADISKIAQLIAPRASTSYPLTLSTAGNGCANDEIRMSFNYGTGFSATAYVGSVLENFGTAATGLSFGGYSGGVIERMRITSAGNVGIGAASPAAKMHLCGSGDNVFRGESTTTGTVANLFITKAGATVVGYYAGVNVTGGAPGGWEVYDAICNISRLYIKSEGSIGIGTFTPSYRLHVNGTFYAAGSSQDYKEGICQYNTDSCLFMCLKPVTYQYKEEYKHLGKELKSETQIGLIAEEVAETYPELAILVNEEANKVVRNVDYEKLSVILLSEVQKLRREVDDLKHKQ